MRVAAIDIGSNTLLMQIVEKNEQNEINILADFQMFARLSENLSITGKISDKSIQKAQQILTVFSTICKEFEVDTVVAVATSAIREAVNSKQVVQELETSFNSNYYKHSPLNIKIISGDEEAVLSFKGSCFDAEMNTVIDIGGGSTEIITGLNNNIIDKISIPIGVVKLTEKFSIMQPVSNYKVSRVRRYIKTQLETVKKNNHNGPIIAVSGTPTALAAIHLNLSYFDISEINNFEFTKLSFQTTVSNVLSLELNDLINRYSMEKHRADVLSAGALLLDEITEYLGKDKFTVSTNGLRYGLALQLFEDLDNKLEVHL